MAQSVGAAAAEGIESGYGMALRGQVAEQEMADRARRTANEQDERQYRRTRDTKADERQRKVDERQRAQDELSMLDKEFGEAQAAYTGAIGQFGGHDKVPPELRTQLMDRSKDVRGRRAAARHRFYQGSVEEQQKEAAEVWSRVQAGQMSLDDLQGDDLARTLMIQSNRSIRDFMGPPEGGASRVQQAALDLEAGMASKNNDLVLRAANVLLEPELRVGVGSEASDGSEIVSKRIVKMVPHPQDPEQFVPIVEVTVKRADGRLGKYMAPVTENRSADPNDNVKSISLEGALERVGQLTTLAEFVNRPEIRKKIEEGKKGVAAGEKWLEEVGLMGLKPSEKKQTTTTSTDLKDRALITKFDAAGNEIGRSYEPYGMPPKAAKGGAAGVGKWDKEFTDIDEGVASGLLTPEEGNVRKRDLMMGIKPADKAKAEKLGAKEKAARDAAIGQADRLIYTVDEALGLTGVTTAGLGGAILKRLPGSSAVDLEETLQTIKANLGFAELQAMRAASPTGGALGAIAVQELNALQSTIASLKAEQSPDKLKGSLQKIRNHYTAWKEAVMKAGDTDGSDVDAPPKPAGPGLQAPGAAPGNKPTPVPASLNLGMSQTPPPDLRAAGRDAAADWSSATNALKSGADPVAVADRMRQLGYPVDATLKAMRGVK